MIRKTLHYNRSEIHLLNEKQDIPNKEFFVVDLELPIEEFWKAQDMAKELEYQLNAGTDLFTVSQLNKKLLTYLHKFVLHEKDRIFLKEQLQARSN